MANRSLDGANRDTRKLFKQIETYEGWEVSRRNSGHFVIEGPERQKVFCSGTASDHRALKNLKRDLAKAGLTL
jgi:hypothetical protein